MFKWNKKEQYIDTNKQKVEELLTRGVEEIIHIDSLRKKLLSGKQLRVKLGIDPTSPHLHLGRAVPLLKLRDFQQLGHKVVLIIGDGTGVIGDTSDKESERPMLTKGDIARNMETYFQQAGRILDMTKVEKRRNSEWLHALTYEEIGEHADQFSVSDFSARENIKKRLDAGKRVSLREILYPLMQGYDSVAVRADVELGGTDQRFNLLAGRVLQEHFNQDRQDILMTPLIEGTDGRKMSSSWGNIVKLTESADSMYGKVMSTNDNVMSIYFTTLTRTPMSEISKILDGLKDGTQNPRDIKMQLAHTIVTMFHNSVKADSAQEKFVSTFQKGDTPTDVKKAVATVGESLWEVFLREKIVDSKNDFRRLVDAGAITNKTKNKKVEDISMLVEKGVYKIGKHRFIEIV